MIKIYKSEDIPTSLSHSAAYDGEDVIAELHDNQQCKCYLCERITKTDYQVEHLCSQKNNIEQRQVWNNLLLACGYCNGKKSQYFDNISHPVFYDVEEVIFQHINYTEKKAEFASESAEEGIQSTINLLERIFNGTGKFRSYRENKFFNEFTQKMNDFLRLSNEYIESPSEENKRAIISSLDITKEFLGFKYWIIKDNPVLYDEFKNYIIWNK